MSIESQKQQFLQGIRDIVRIAAFDIHKNIVERTPIDTGRARSSWNLNPDEADESVTPVLRAEKNPISGEIINDAAAGAETLSADQALAAALTQQQKIGPLAAVIVISNNLPYIERLEQGSSRQAPAGMVAVSTTQGEVQAILEEAIAKAGI